MQAVCAYSPQVVIQSSFRVRELIDSRLIEQVLSENEIDWKELAFSEQVLSENEIDWKELAFSKQVLSENEIDWKELAFSKQVLSENEIDVWEWDWLNQPSQNRMRWEGGGGEIK